MNQCRQHENIVLFYGVAIRSNEEHRGERYMIMQYYDLGDLVKLAETPKEHPDAPTLLDKMYLSLDIAQGLHHLFQCGYHHGDLHPKNILIDYRRGGPPQQGRYLAKLTDFGLRRKRDNMNAFSSQQFGGVWQFMAPERMVKNRPRFDVRCDIFALGVIYWFIMAGRYPFKDPSMFSPGAREERTEGTPDWYYNLYTQAWSEDPNARQQTLDEILQVFRHHLGIQTPQPSTQYLDPGHGHGYPSYPTTSYGYDGSYATYDGQPHHYSGSSAGSSTIRGSPMMTHASMQTPSGQPYPSSPLMTNSNPRNRQPPFPNGAPGSIYRPQS